eukprot:TRINITY_DN3102_c0_g1_i1.p1 TRINITY_DN3102_c0_g1~~TRINITY_DN3102_c0_g1_i1.p1  ORF type:complete len:474 (-),score=133.24 TRINITY_DN3102_c0_g1_i1:39-1460(-)
MRKAESVQSVHNLMRIPKGPMMIGYFEIRVFSIGQDGAVAMGLCPNGDSATMPGWFEGSYGQHGDDGGIVIGGSEIISGLGKWNEDDIVGCGINWDQKTIFFTLNGQLTKVLENIQNLEDVFPTIGIRDVGAKIRLNFGAQQFAFDLIQYQRELITDHWQWQPYIYLAREKDEESSRIRKSLVIFRRLKHYKQLQKILTKDFDFDSEANEKLLNDLAILHAVSIDPTKSPVESIMEDLQNTMNDISMILALAEMKDIEKGELEGEPYRIWHILKTLSIVQDRSLSDNNVFVRAFIEHWMENFGFNDNIPVAEDEKRDLIIYSLCKLFSNRKLNHVDIDDEEGEEEDLFPTKPPYSEGDEQALLKFALLLKFESKRLKEGKADLDKFLQLATRIIILYNIKLKPSTAEQDDIDSLMETIEQTCSSITRHGDAIKTIFESSHLLDPGLDDEDDPMKTEEEEVEQMESEEQQNEQK